jgi:hypothetical protein
MLVGENHLQALLLAQVGTQYLHTAPADAMETLSVCETLGAGMGAKQKEADGGKGEGKEKEKFQTAMWPSMTQLTMPYSASGWVNDSSVCFLFPSFIWFCAEGQAQIYSSMQISCIVW